MKVTNFENLIELMVIGLASVCLGAQEMEDIEKWFAAFGIVLAYIGKLKILLYCRSSFNLMYIIRITFD